MEAQFEKSNIDVGRAFSAKIEMGPQILALAWVQVLNSDIRGISYDNVELIVFIWKKWFVQIFDFV